MNILLSTVVANRKFCLLSVSGPPSSVWHRNNFEVQTIVRVLLLPLVLPARESLRRRLCIDSMLLRVLRRPANSKCADVNRVTKKRNAYRVAFRVISQS